MQLILNELSFSFPVDNEYIGKELIKNFINTYQKAKRYGIHEQVIMDKDYRSFDLSKNYNIGKWLNDPSVEKELKRAFLSLLNKSIAFNKDTFKDAKFDINHSEFLFNNQNAIGCLIAYETNNCVISFSSADCWKKAEIQGNYSTLDNEDTINSPIPVSVFNICDEKTTDSFLKKYNSEFSIDLYSFFKTGKSILDNRDKFFSNLIFCENAVKQLNTLINPIVIRQVVKHLKDLQDYISKCDSSFDKNALKHASPESESTLNKFRNAHTFKLPNGSDYTFSWHLRYTGDNGRIFFFPDTQKKVCYIGYIGRKLPTVKYPTP